jgi:hypothetical protein
MKGNNSVQTGWGGGGGMVFDKCDGCSLSNINLSIDGTKYN